MTSELETEGKQVNYGTFRVLGTIDIVQRNFYLILWGSLILDEWLGK